MATNRKIRIVLLQLAQLRTVRRTVAAAFRGSRHMRRSNRSGLVLRLLELLFELGDALVGFRAGGGLEFGLGDALREGGVELCRGECGDMSMKREEGKGGEGQNEKTRRGRGKNEPQQVASDSTRHGA